MFPQHVAVPTQKTFASHGGRPQVPLSQNGAVAGQTLSHLPQLNGSFCRFTQPFPQHMRFAGQRMAAHWPIPPVPRVPPRRRRRRRHPSYRRAPRAATATRRTAAPRAPAAATRRAAASPAAAAAAAGSRAVRAGDARRAGAARARRATGSRGAAGAAHRPARADRAATSGRACRSTLAARATTAVAGGGIGADAGHVTASRKRHGESAERDTDSDCSLMAGDGHHD
jgi:hypothetical protein